MTPTSDQVWIAYGEYRLMKSHGAGDFYAMYRALIMGSRIPDGTPHPSIDRALIQRGKDYAWQDAMGVK